MNRFVMIRGDREYATHGAAVDLSIPLHFDGPQPGFFGADSAAARPMHSDEFIGDTRLGGSCNAEHVDLIPHCNGTHTECVGHLTNERVAVNGMATDVLYLAALVSVIPYDGSNEQATLRARKADRVITRRALQAAVTGTDAKPDALIVRTLPNDADKTRRDWEVSTTPYFTVDAMRWIVEQDIRHLLVDLPSVDRLDDQHLVNHRVFWGLAAGSRTVEDATRDQATITELIYVPDKANDGLYLLDLQLAPFVSDATPSRPLLYRIAE